MASSPMPRSIRTTRIGLSHRTPFRCLMLCAPGEAPDRCPAWPGVSASLRKAPALSCSLRPVLQYSFRLSVISRCRNGTSLSIIKALSIFGSMYSNNKTLFSDVIGNSFVQESSAVVVHAQKGEVSVAFRDKLDALKVNLAPENQQARSPILSQAIEALIAAEQVNRLPQVGEIAPAFTLPDATGTTISSAALLRHGPLVLTFYRGLWCPYYQRDLHAFEEALPGIRSVGASVVGIAHRFASDDSRALQHAREIGFPVLDDGEGDVAVRFCLRWAPADSRLIEEPLGLNL